MIGALFLHSSSLFKDKKEVFCVHYLLRLLGTALRLAKTGLPGASFLAFSGTLRVSRFPGFVGNAVRRWINPFLLRLLLEINTTV